MFCLKCGKSIPDRSSFCMFCGTVLPQILSTPVPPVQDQPFQSTELAASESSPFGERETPLDLPPSLEKFTVSLPIENEDELESFSLPELPEEDFSLSELSQTNTIRRCKLCNRELTVSNTTGFCVSCTNNRSFIPTADDTAFHLDLDLDVDYPEDYQNTSIAPKNKSQKKPPRSKKPKKIRLLPIMAISLITLALALATVFFANGGFDLISTGTSSSLSAKEREIAAFSQNMVKEKAANPASVHFDARSLSISEKTGIWTVKQSFERLAPDGKTVESSYVAVVKAGDSGKSYQALMLQVDNQTLYDSR